MCQPGPFWLLSLWSLDQEGQGALRSLGQLRAGKHLTPCSPGLYRSTGTAGVGGGLPGGKGQSSSEARSLDGSFMKAEL